MATLANHESGFLHRVFDKIQFLAAKVSSNLILFLCLSLTVMVTVILSQIIAAENTTRFDRIATGIETAIESRILIYENILIATRGLFLARLSKRADQPLSAAEFRDFVSSLQIRERYPGIQGVGFARRVDRRHQSSIRIWPEGDRDLYFPIEYLEPADWRNQRAIGYDMYSETVRRQAMSEARDQGRPTASGPVTLVQETSFDQQPGFLIYVPVYRADRPIETVSERRQAIQGFVYSPFRAVDLLQQISRSTHNGSPDLRIQIFDGAPTKENLLYDSLKMSGGAGQSVNAEVRHARTGVREIMGRSWTIIVSSNSDFFEMWSRKLPNYMAALGVLISFLIFFVTRFANQLNASLINELKTKERSEREILKARELAEEANRAKSRFLANMTHEIRTPLGVIVGFADLALDACRDCVEVREYLESIKRNGEQLSDLVGDVLDVSKIEANKLEVERVRFFLPELIDGVISSLRLRAEKKKIALIWDQNQDIPGFIVSDPTKIRQVLINLIGNAIKFTDVGEVRLTVRLLSEPRKGIPVELQFLIRDTGIGIPERHRSELFKPFSQADSSMTRRFGGTGLGLVLSRQLAQALGGDILLKESSEGRGSVFEFRLLASPFESLWQECALPSAIKAAHESRDSEAKSLSGRHILVVEDSVDNQILIERYLEAAGARVELAANGLEGVTKAMRGGFDLVLMDIQMPVLDGYQATKQLRTGGYQKPIVALTAHAIKEEQDRALQSGFSAYLTKPLQRLGLIRVVHDLVSPESNGPNHR